MCAWTRTVLLSSAPWACAAAERQGVAPELTEAQLTQLERRCTPTVGACAGQFTANTMAMVSETLGLALPLYPGDVVFFQPGVLPHLVRTLREQDRTKRLVVTMFNCEPTSDFLNRAGSQI